MEPGTAPDLLLSAVIARHATRLLGLPGIVGIGAGEVGGRPCLMLLASCPAGELPALPATLEGYPLVIERTGRLQSQTRGTPG